MAPLRLTLYMRPGCHLCDDMKEIVLPLAAEYDCQLAQVDISGDPTLESELGQEIPVLFVNGRKAFKYRTSARDLRRRLRRERGSW